MKYGGEKVRMPLQSFIDQYCKDIMEIKSNSLDNPFKEFIFDEVVDGQSVIYDKEGHEIPVSEIVQLPFKEFVLRYPFNSAAEAFRNYVSAYNIITGEDLVREVAVHLERAQQELSTYVKPEGDVFDL